MTRRPLLNQLRNRCACSGIRGGLRLRVLLLLAAGILAACAPDEALRRYRGEPVERTLGEPIKVAAHRLSMGWPTPFVLGELIALDLDWGMLVVLQSGDTSGWLETPRLLEIPVTEVGHVIVYFRRYDRQPERDVFPGLFGSNPLQLTRVFSQFTDKQQMQLRQYSRHPLGLTPQLRQRLLERYKQDDFIQYPPGVAPVE